ncbi:MAG: hypothetical protein ACK6CT_04820 [Planctomycetia bacterium]|jgi:hypothetical protein
MTAPLPDRAMIERLVAEVIGRLGAAAAARASRSAMPAAATPAPASGYGAPTPATDAHLADRVITLAILERLPSGIRRVTIDPRAVITPSARDRAKETGIAIVRGAAPASQPVPIRPFVVASAACAADPAVKAAGIARAVQGAVRLPASGLADVIAAIAVQASRDAARGVLLTSSPAVAVILANRSASLRAVSGRNAATLAANAAACAANLLVVDPATFSGGLDRLCADFAGHPSGPIPVELATAPAGCGCTSHPH